MPTKFIRKHLSRLQGETSGNAMLLVAMGAPILMGTTGLAVDTAQWYMWQRELQYAADQAALAGAWARGNGDLGNEYYTRARQEFTANVRIVTNYTTLDEAILADYDGGTENSVVVSASTTGTLPFASFMLGTSTTVRVNSQAVYETTAERTACMYALKRFGDKALYLNGNTQVDAECGAGTMSNGNAAVRTDGSSGEANFGTVLSAGGIDDKQGNFGDSDLLENLENLFDPFAGLTPPESPTSRSLICSDSNTSNSGNGNNNTSGTWMGDKVVTTVTTYNYYKGPTASDLKKYNNYPSAKATSTASTTTTGETYTPKPTDTKGTPIAVTKYIVSGSGKDAIWEEPVETVSTSYLNLTQATILANQTLLPGTYSDFNITCDTTLAGGVYVIDGGELNVNGNYKLIGYGIMFVLKNGASLQFNGTSDIILTPMDVNQLIAAGVPSEQAARLENMLIFEDPDSEGNRQTNTINGNSKMEIVGNIYTPKTGLTLAGNVDVDTGGCLMIATLTLEIQGGAFLKSLCDPNYDKKVVVGEGGTRVRLVA